MVPVKTKLYGHSMKSTAIISALVLLLWIAIGSIATEHVPALEMIRTAMLMTIPISISLYIAWRVSLYVEKKYPKYNRINSQLIILVSVLSLVIMGILYYHLNVGIDANRLLYIALEFPIIIIGSYALVISRSYDIFDKKTQKFLLVFFVISLVSSYLYNIYAYDEVDTSIKYCLSNGGEYIIQDNFGICKFDDGTACFVEEYYLGQCAPGMYLLDELLVVRQYYGNRIQITQGIQKSSQCNCPPCTVWSTCDNGNQVRTCSKCDASTNYLCRSYMDEKIC